MSEAELQTSVVQLAKWSGFLAFHVIDSRKSMGVGFPDLVLVHKLTGRVVYVELKSEKGRVSDAQQQWLKALGLLNETYVWRPEDWTSGAIREALIEGPELAA